MHSETAKNTWYILGAGAIGSLWAAYWRLAGFPVVLITKNPRKSDSIHLTIEDKPTRVDVEQLTIDQLTKGSHTIDYLFVSTKAHHTNQALQSIKPFISKHATILSVQNGLAPTINTLLPTQTRLTGITTDGAYRTDQQSVVHAAKGETFIGCQPHFLEYLPTASLTIHRCADIEERQWKKFAINCAVNALTAIHQCRNGDLVGNEKAQQTMGQLCEEITAVSKALGHKINNAEILHQQANQVLSLTANNYSSMYQDMANGNTSEIDCLNGALVTLAQQQSVPCSENIRIVEAIKALETKAYENSSSIHRASVTKPQ